MEQRTFEQQKQANPTYAYVYAFVEELQHSGIQHVVICPGSRSTPLAMAFAAHPTIRVWLHIDERSAAFFGLGLAKRLTQPVALLCTSGTAAANFLPAIVEAHLTHIPLLVLTADRPHELRENGAPQAIDQNRLYGSHVKRFFDVALPEATNAALRYIRTLANRATALTQAIPAGPVHLNLPFREPLIPASQPDAPLPPLNQRDPLAWTGRPDSAYVTISDAELGTPPLAQLQLLAEQVSNVERGLIIVGTSVDPALTVPLVKLAQKLGYPILADPLSQLRCGKHDQSHVISSYDAFLRIESFLEQAEPDLVLRFGAMPTCKPLLLYLKRYASCPQIVIDGNGGWEEPTQLASAMIHANPLALCHSLLELLAVRTSNVWLHRWQRTDQITRQALYTTLQDFTQLFEGRVFTELADLLPESATLYVGNSMPVRDLDTFFWCNTRNIRILGNRGASGIDGMISCALGASAAASASGSNDPTILVIGDLSFFHDLNGLLAAHLYKLNLVIVLVNNDGGGIFSFLPQAAYPEHFEQLFGTPTGLDFRPVVQMYGGTFHHSETWEAFRNAMTQGMRAGGLHVIEVRTERASNVNMHRQLWQVVEEALGKAEENTQW
jgi:2-succinyl-5-enolpyruvyl-6-hydroxy-3-cyclohexene-1-carboxylate synthase